MANPVKLTPKRLKELQDEMVWMKTVREKEIAEMIKEARSFGDLSENSEYDEAKDQQESSSPTRRRCRPFWTTIS